MRAFALVSRPRDTTLVVAAAAVFSLYVPSVSIGVLFATVVALHVPLVRHLLRSRPLFHRTLALVAFCATYFPVAATHGFISVTDGAKYTFAFIGAYLLGYWYGNRTYADSPLRQLAFLLAVATGSTVFAYLCARAAIITAPGLELSERAAPNYWNRNDLLNVPGLGAMATLGMCTVALAFFGSTERIGRRAHAGIAVVSVLLAVAGIQTNLIFQNRSPFITLLVALTIASLAALRATRGLGHRLLRVGTAAAVAAGVLILMRSELFVGRMLYQRFEEMGLHSDRFSAWATMAENLLQEPFGGRTVDVGLNYVHNLWLDVARDAGVLPFFFLIVFHALHLRALARYSLSSAPTDVRLLTLVLAVAYFATFMAEPVLAFAPAYFVTSVLLLGFLASADALSRVRTRDPRDSAPVVHSPPGFMR